MALLASAAILYWRRIDRSIKPANVILITLDTLRADHLGVYGYARAQTPNIDRWAEKSTVFLNATATVPLTLPAHSSIMTGTYPFVHGVRDNGGFYLEEKSVTLAETLKTAGFQTGGFVSAFVLDRRWGIAQGFQHFFDNFELSKFKMLSLDSVQRDGKETVDEAVKWLDQKSNAPFFLWIHLYDPHTPYDPPEPFRSEFKGTGAFGLYDGEIAYTDNLVGRIHDYLETNKLLNTTLVVLTADHGESLGQHQESGHGFFIYDATMHVPLIIWAPGEMPRTVEDQVRSIDIFATICDAARVAAPPENQGVSLLPLVRGKSLPKKLTAYSESHYAKFHYGWSDLKSLRTAEYKYIQAPRPEFYRVSQDRDEKQNLYGTEQKRSAPFESEITTMTQAHAGSTKGPKAMDSESLEKLQALGYIGTYISGSKSEESGPLSDPKDKIRLYNLIKLAQWNSAEGKIQEARDQIERVLSEDARILEAHLVHGSILSKQKDFAGARGSFQKALNLNPDYSAALFAMAKAFMDERNYEAAKAGFQRLAELDPRDTKPFFQLGDIALEEKDFAKAKTYFRKVIELEPDQAVSRNRLGAVYLELGNHNEAMQELDKALEFNQRIPNAHFNKGLVFEARGQWELAAEEYRKEISLYPEDYPAHFNLSRTYRKLGRFSDERKELEDCIREKPDFGVAYLYLAKHLMDRGDDLLKAKELAESGLTKTLEESQRPFAHYLLADIYNRLGRPREAAVQLQQAKKTENRAAGSTH